jgi:hypothetical protein
MNRWWLAGLVAGGVLLFLYLRSEPQPVPITAPGAGSLPETRGSIPYDRPVPEPAAAPSTPRPTFHGYPCEGDCSEDEAGYRWAEKNQIADPDNCTGSTAGFIEGCRAYARPRAERRFSK